MAGYTLDQAFDEGIRGDIAASVRRATQRFFTLEERTVSAIQNCSRCTRRTPWNGGGGETFEWTLIRQHEPSYGILDTHHMTLRARSAIVGVVCPDCTYNGPKPDVWWWRI